MPIIDLVGFTQKRSDFDLGFIKHHRHKTSKYLSSQGIVMSSRSFQRFFPAFFCFSVCMSVLETHAADQIWKQNREVMPAVTAGQSDDGKQDAFHVLDGYQVEKLFDVPRDV